MSKLVYPKEGVLPRCRGYIDSCVESISNARGNCSFDIPDGFPYRGYLESLGDRLDGYLNEANSIKGKIKATDQSFNNLSDHLVAAASKISPVKITKRERMIK